MVKHTSCNALLRQSQSSVLTLFWQIYGSPVRYRSTISRWATDGLARNLMRTRSVPGSHKKQAHALYVCHCNFRPLLITFHV